MKLRILSDLHLESCPWSAPCVEQDVVVLAGDISPFGEGISWAERQFSCPVLYVPGNHEYYGTSLEEGLSQLRERAKNSSVHVLSDDELVLGGVRFLGATLWTDYRSGGNEPLARMLAAQSIQDFKHLHLFGMRPLSASDILERHYASRAFLRRSLSQPFPGKTVVITHHAPSLQSLRQEESLLSRPNLHAYYGSSLEHMTTGADLWVHGHVHASADYRVGDTRVLCNPRGYARKNSTRYNPRFEPNLIVEL